MGRIAGAVVPVVVAAALLAGCGGSSGPTANTTASNAATVSAVAPESGCGSFTANAPKDPDGVYAAMDAKHQAALAGYPSPVRRSAWSDWKPSHPAPYNVAIVWAQLTTDFQIATTDRLRKVLGDNPEIGNVDFQTTGDNLNVAQEIQLMNQAIARKPDLIILEPLTAAAFAPQIKKAAAAGIPVLLVLDSYDSPNVVNIGGNNVLGSAEVASYMVRAMGGQGNLLSVNGLAGSSPDNDTDTGVKLVLANCPNVKHVGDVYGQFVPAAAKSETLKFLGTHPQKIDGVMQTAGMAPGIMQAFQQTGRAMPIVADIANSKGSLGWWRQNRDSYTGIGNGLGGESYADAIADVTTRMLHGDGLKANVIVDRLPLITDATLDDWAQPGWTLTTPGIAPGPKDAFAPPSFLDSLFTNHQ